MGGLWHAGVIKDISGEIPTWIYLPGQKKNNTVEIFFQKASYSVFCPVYFFKTTSKYAFSKVILRKVELIMASRWAYFDLIYCHPSSKSSTMRKVGLIQLCVYQKKPDNYRPFYYQSYLWLWCDFTVKWSSYSDTRFFFIRKYFIRKLGWKSTQNKKKSKKYLRLKVRYF